MVAEGVKGRVHSAESHFALRSEGERPIRYLEGGDVVLSGLTGGQLVFGAIAQPDHQTFAIAGTLLGDRG